MIRIHGCIVLVACACLATGPLRAQESKALAESEFQKRMRDLAAEPAQSERLSRAVDLAQRHLLSSLQVKAIAAGLRDDTARLEFAMAAYPRTVDPENFYDVYDAFTSFSKMMRLHDWIRANAQPGRAVVMMAPAAVPDSELRGILEALRKESFDRTRDKLGRQVLTSSRRKFLSTQIKAMLKCFDFDANRLEFAKFAYDYVYDPEQYFQVNDTFDFSSNVESLAQHIRKRNQSAPQQTR